MPPAPGELPKISPERFPSWLPSQLNQWGVTIEQYVSTIAAATADQQTAVNWLAANAETYGIDPRMIAAGGYSAGGMSSLLLGTGAIDGVSANVPVVFTMAGQMFGLETAINAGDAAIYVLHGANDTTVPVSEVAFLEQAALAAGVPFQSRILPGVGHGLTSQHLLNDYEPFFEFMLHHLTPVPEPSSFALGAIAMISLAALQARRRRNRAGASTFVDNSASVKRQGIQLARDSGAA